MNNDSAESLWHAILIVTFPVYVFLSVFTWATQPFHIKPGNRFSLKEVFKIGWDALRYI